jgi:hypothetical protein
MAGITTVGQVSLTSAATQIVGARGQRTGLVIQNDGSVTVFRSALQLSGSPKHGFQIGTLRQFLCP